MVWLSHPYMTTGKTIALTRWTFVGKVMSVVFNMLSSLVIAFLPRSKCLNFMAAVTICSDFGAQENKVNTISIVSPSICHEVMGLDAVILIFWMLSFKLAFSLSSFTFVKRLFSCSSLSAIGWCHLHTWGLSMFLLALSILACASPSLAFHMMFFACKLNKQDDNIQPWRMYSFPNLEAVIVPRPVITAASWPAYRFLRRQVRWSGIPISSRIFHIFLWSTVKGFIIVNEAEVDVFLEFSCFFYDPVDVGYLISGCSAFSKSSLNIWKFSVHVLLQPSLENFEHYFAIVWNECNCVVVWIFFDFALLWDWSENWPFPVLWPLLNFPNLLWHIEGSTFTASSLRIWNSSAGIPSPPLALFIVMLSKAHLTSHSRMSGSRSVITPSWLSESWILNSFN